jgi:hypothetical protein
VVVSLVQTVVQWKYTSPTLGSQSNYFASSNNSFDKALDDNFVFHVDANNNVKYKDWFLQLDTFVNNNNPSYPR